MVPASPVLAAPVAPAAGSSSSLFAPDRAVLRSVSLQASRQGRRAAQHGSQGHARERFAARPVSVCSQPTAQLARPPAGSVGTSLQFVRWVRRACQLPRSSCRTSAAWWRPAGRFAIVSASEVSAPFAGSPAVPNPSFNWTRNGRPLGPATALCYPAAAGPSALPLRAS